MNFWERNDTEAGNGRYGGRDGENGANRKNSGGYDEQAMRDKYDEYSSKSEDQLMSELSAMVARMKNEGTFDPSAIENLYNTASPFLNEAQRQRMKQIVDMLVR